MNYRTASDEVIIATDGIVSVRPQDVSLVVRKGTTNARGRARLCVHPGPDDPLHEMLIVLDRATYIRPHRHAAKTESFHIIEGELDVVVFHDDGSVRDVISMGPYGSGYAFYYRIMEPCYHSVVIKTPYVLFHETTNGPFNRADTDFAPWSPAEGTPGVPAFMEKVQLLAAGTTLRRAA